MGTRLDDLTLLADISKERVTLAELGAVDGAGGKVSGSGELALDPRQDFPFDLTVSLDKFHVVRRDDVTAGTSGRTRLPRSEERRVGQEGVRKCRSRWAPEPKKKTNKRKIR